jgi:hypothetical protein
MQEVDEILDFVRLENVAEGWHRGATILNLMLDLLFAQAFTNSAQIRSKVSSPAIYAMAVLTSLFMKEGSSRLLTVV